MALINIPYAVQPRNELTGRPRIEIEYVNGWALRVWENEFEPGHWRWSIVYLPDQLLWRPSHVGTSASEEDAWRDVRWSLSHHKPIPETV